MTSFSHFSPAIWMIAGLLFIGGVAEVGPSENLRLYTEVRPQSGYTTLQTDHIYHTLSAKVGPSHKHMTLSHLQKLSLPDSPGVYTFRDGQKRPLYIGRATSLRDRVKSYFKADLIVTRGPRIVDMITKAESLTWEETDSVLEAIILEGVLIKRYQPYYNIDDRDDKSSQYIVITDEDWPRVFLVRERDFDKTFGENDSNREYLKGRNNSRNKEPIDSSHTNSKDKILPFKVKRAFGPYPHGGLIKEALKILRRMFPFKDKKSHDPRHDAFYRAIGKSPSGLNEEARMQYLKTINMLIMFFDGKKKQIRLELEKEMKEFATNEEFEKAGEVKRLLYALDHINDMALLKREANNSARNFRIEAYDIAHLSGTNVVGALAVSLNGQSSNSDYRKFKVSKQANNDIAGLVEIISRRLNHSEWAYPDLIVVDGNEVHKHAAEAVLQARRISIPVIAVTKDDKHKASKLLGSVELIKRLKSEIVAVNAEAHRFAIAFHRKRRVQMR